MSHCRVLVSSLDTTRHVVRTRWLQNAHVGRREHIVHLRTDSISELEVVVIVVGADGPGATATVDVAADVVTTTRTPMTLFCCAQRFVDLVAG